MLGNGAVAQYAVAQFPGNSNILIALVGRFISELRGKAQTSAALRLTAREAAILHARSQTSGALRLTARVAVIAQNTVILIQGIKLSALSKATGKMLGLSGTPFVGLQSYVVMAFSGNARTSGKLPLTAHSSVTAQESGRLGLITKLSGLTKSVGKILSLPSGQLALYANGSSAVKAAHSLIVTLRYISAQFSMIAKGSALAQPLIAKVSGSVRTAVKAPSGASPQTSLSGRSLTATRSKTPQTVSTALTAHETIESKDVFNASFKVPFASKLKTTLRSSLPTDFAAILSGKVLSLVRKKVATSASTSLTGQTRTVARTGFAINFTTALLGKAKTLTKVPSAIGFVISFIGRALSVLHQRGNQNYSTGLSGSIKTSIKSEIAPPSVTTELSGVVSTKTKIRSMSYLGIAMSGLTRLFTAINSLMRSPNVNNATQIDGEASKNLTVD